MHSIVPLVHNGKQVYAIVIHEDGWQRIADHDPAVVEGKILQKEFGRGEAVVPVLPLMACDFLICYEKRDEFFAKARELKTGPALLQWLGRNWKNTPESPLAEGTHEFSDISVES